LAEQVPETVYEDWFAEVMRGAEVMVTTGAIPTAVLLVTRLPDPVWAFTVCEAVIVTGPSGKLLTSRPAVAQALLSHRAEAATEPTRMLTVLPLAEQVPETI
jgi:hypothetical protein